MKHLLSKDLGLIFLLTTIYIIIISFPHLIYNKSFLELGFLIFPFTGYSLISLLRPEENYRDIFSKPVLILEFSVLIILAVSVILKFSSLGLHLMILIMVLSIITMILSISAYIRRIQFYKSNGNKIISHRNEKKPIQKTSPIFELNSYYDIIIIDLLSIFTIITYFIQYLNINLLNNVIGILYMVFIPGYLLMVILLPKKSGLEPIIRLGLSVGVSLPITSLVGLVLHYTKYGISINSLLFPLVILTLILSIFVIRKD